MPTWTQFLAGSKTFIVGLVLAVGPQIVTFITGFDFTHTFGLSPNTATIVGVVMIALRAVTTTPIFQK